MSGAKENIKKPGIHFLLRLLIFWLATFTLYRILFLSFNFKTILANGIFSASKSLLIGIRLDLATIAMLIFPSLILWGLHQFFHLRVIQKIHTGYIFIVVFLITLLSVSNIRMYHEWGALINYGVFNYVKHPGDVLTFISTKQLLLVLAFLLLIYAISILMFKKIVTNFDKVAGNLLTKSLTILLSLMMLPILMRGGIQMTPINESTAYYSDVIFYNHAAINPLWYFVHSYINLKQTSNPYQFTDSTLAENRNNTLYASIDTAHISILNTPRPNIVLIILESWTSDVIKSLGGEVDVTPNFDTLIHHGLLFTQVYAAGSRTEHGLISVLSGFPPPPQVSIITIPSKAEKLNSINSLLIENGYTSSFYYGGDINFANMKSYLLSSGFNTIIDKDQFEKAQLNSKWGAHDQFVLEKQLHDMHSGPVPFFSTVLTLSSHEPFEVPMEAPFSSVSESGKFRKAVYYTDHCMGEYFKAAKKETWFDNTLFIMVADHGHRLPRLRDFNGPESKHIPVLFLGGALKKEFYGKTIGKISNQNDIATTLLQQLHMETSGFSKSKNMLNPDTKDFAYYTTNNVLGWITPDQFIRYTYATQKADYLNPETGAARNDSLLTDAKAYLQSLYQQFLNY